MFALRKHGIIAQLCCPSDNLPSFRKAARVVRAAASIVFHFIPPIETMTAPTAAHATDVELANAIRALAMDAVEAAKSGHPGMPMGMAEIAVALWNRHLRHNPANPHWPDRDRFVLSNGHGSMLQYALLHLTGYDLPIGELRNFRQLHSKTPGHPEVGVTPGVETTTRPARPRACQRRRHGARRSVARERVQSARPRDRRSSHVRVPGRRLPDGGHFARGVLARRHARPGQAHRVLRRQRNFDRRPRRGLVHRRHAAALRRLRLACHRAASTVTMSPRSMPRSPPRMRSPIVPRCCAARRSSARARRPRPAPRPRTAPRLAKRKLRPRAPRSAGPIRRSRFRRRFTQRGTRANAARCSKRTGTRSLPPIAPRIPSARRSSPGAWPAISPPTFMRRPRRSSPRRRRRARRSPPARLRSRRSKPMPSCCRK